MKDLEFGGAGERRSHYIALFTNTHMPRHAIYTQFLLFSPNCPCWEICQSNKEIKQAFFVGGGGVGNGAYFLFHLYLCARNQFSTEIKFPIFLLCILASGWNFVAVCLCFDRVKGVKALLLENNARFWQNRKRKQFLVVMLFCGRLRENVFIFGWK